MIGTKTTYGYQRKEFCEMMKQVISLSKYMKVLVPSMAMCSLILGTFIYPLSAYADNTTIVYVNTTDQTFHMTMGITDNTQGRLLDCRYFYWPIGTSTSITYVNIGDKITVGIFQPFSDCTKKRNRLAVLYHGRIRGELTLP
jgi:hypothetical protein